LPAGAKGVAQEEADAQAAQAELAEHHVSGCLASLLYFDLLR
jgi:hypothetical protein